MERKIYCIFLLLLLNFSVNLQAKNSKFLLITGCGRSGTTFMTCFLNNCGVEVGHEKLGVDGIVSWFMVVDKDVETEYKHILHQVRHPLKVITSFFVNIKSLDRPEWKFIRKHVPEISIDDSLIVHCAKYWYYWNLKAEKLAEMNYKIEELSFEIDKITQHTGLSLSNDILNKMPNNINNWLPTSNMISWQTLKGEISPVLYQNILDMCKRYGYDLSDEPV